MHCFFTPLKRPAVLSTGGTFGSPRRFRGTQVRALILDPRRSGQLSAKENQSESAWGNLENES